MKTEERAVSHIWSSRKRTILRIKCIESRKSRSVEKIGFFFVPAFRPQSCMRMLRARRAKGARRAKEIELILGNQRLGTPAASFLFFHGK